jgi:pimeloyl-ACP methyl ester carboxylesterase
MKKRYLIAGTVGLVSAAVAVKLLSRPRDVDWEKNRETVFNADYSRFVMVDGVRVHYQEAGSKTAPPLLLIHGFASSTLVWSEVLLKLADLGFHVIAPDLLGYGYSGKPRQNEYTIKGQARMIIGLLDQLGIERADFVGTSYGGAVAATCALDHPDRVKKLVMIGAVSNNDPTRYLLVRFFRSPVIGELIAPLLIGSRVLLRRRMKRVYDRHSLVLDERRVESRHRPLRAAATQRAMIRTARHWDAERIGREAHLIKQPTLLVWGEIDRDVPVANGERLNREIPGSRLVIFRDCGHLPQEEFPREFTEVVAQFLSPLECGGLSPLECGGLSPLECGGKA